VSTYDVIVDESPTSPNQKEATWAMLQQILPVVGKMLPPATWLALLKYSPLPTSAQKDISDSIAQSQQNQPPNPEAAKAAAELQAQNAKAQADIANHKALTDAKIESMQREAEAKTQIALHSAAAESVKNMSQPQIGPNGEVIPPQQDGTALVMAMMHEFQIGMKGIADAMSAPKQIVRDQNGDPIGIAPMRPTNAVVN
jgi:flagellar biosynthesis GTPase FlhF